MSVVGLTFGNAANAIRPSAANAASVPTSATIRASGWIALVPGEPGGERDREDRERAELPAHALTSAVPRPTRPIRHECDALLGDQCAARAPEDPRGLGREVGAAGEDLRRGTVGDRRAVGQQHDPLGERGHELGVVGGDQHSGVERAQQRAQARPCGRGPFPESARRGTRPRSVPLRIVEHDREREPLLLPTRQVAWMAVGERGVAEPDGRERAGRRLLRDRSWTR